MYDYIKDPATITEESFRQIASMADLSDIDPRLHPIAMRLIHSSGNLEIVRQLRWHGDVMQAGVNALRDSASILCDVEMVKNGLSKKFIPHEPHCFLNRHGVASEAKRLGITRCMAALVHWQPYIANAIVIIGSAPTALYRLLEILSQGEEKPALIIATPVGFVGAAESKAALLEYATANDIAAVTLNGRVGGSALAAATFNAIAVEAHEMESYDGH